MKKFNLLTSLMILFTCVACKHSLPTPSNPIAERTVIIYAMAENSLHSFLRYDMLEIEEACGNIPSNTRLLVYADDCNLPAIYEVTTKGIKKWKEYPQDHLSTDSVVMRTVLHEILTHFPAHKQGLVLWSHGNGWIPQNRSIGIDNGNNSFSNTGIEMNIPTLRRVLEEFTHWEYILFDACAMQGIEVAYELRNVVDYILGSPAEINAYGAPYHKILKYMMQGDVQNIAQEYFKHYKENGAGSVISLVQCKGEGMEQLRKATKEVLWQANNSIQSRGVGDVQIYYPYSLYSKWVPEPYDMEHAMYQHLDSATYSNWKKSLENVILYREGSPMWTSSFSGYKHSTLRDSIHYCALSMFIPQAKYDKQEWNKHFHEMQWYKAVGWDELGW